MDRHDDPARPRPERDSTPIPPALPVGWRVEVARGPDVAKAERVEYEVFLASGYCEANEDGRVSEGSAEHIFLVRDGVLLSPPSTEDNLDGITRRSIIDMAQEDLGLEFKERTIGRSDAS